MNDPFTHNPLRTRADLQAAVRSLFYPLKPYFSSGGARVRLGATGAHFANAAAELEGFSRPLWGLAPLALGGGDFADWELYRRGLANGSDPQHPEYWGAAGDKDQRLVEMAAIGFALALIPQHLWEPLGRRERENLVRWLGQINHRQVPDMNWLFFRVMVNLGLAHVGAEYSPQALKDALDRLETFYLGEGWYMDGPSWQRDYYVAFAMHFYGLIYARLVEPPDPERAARFRERAALFAHDFAHWFAAHGAALPFGRSLTYRFAQGAFWGALAFAGVEVFTPGIIKGLTLRHLRWWSRRPIFNGDGTLSIGYGYPNLNMAEAYNSPLSPYWAMKFFIPLALPESHPFWASEESPFPALSSIKPQPQAGMILCHDADHNHVFALSSGQHAIWARHGAEKYAKFAYSTAFAFSVPSGRYGLAQAAPDSMLALSDDGAHYLGRESPLESKLDDDRLYSVWRPWPDVTVETWLLPRLPWHIRVHRLRSARPLWSAEGGFALDRTGDEQPDQYLHLEDEGHALARYPAGLSGLRDLQGKRSGEVMRVDPNTNLLAPRTVLPLLRAQHLPGEHWLACAVLGQPGPQLHREDDDWLTPPMLPEGFPLAPGQ